MYVLLLYIKVQAKFWRNEPNYPPVEFESQSAPSFVSWTPSDNECADGSDFDARQSASSARYRGGCPRGRWRAVANSPLEPELDAAGNGCRPGRSGGIHREVF